MSGYSDIVSDGGMDPRHKLDEVMYRLTVEQRDSAWREVEIWKLRYEGLLRNIADLKTLTPPPAMLGHAESYNLGRENGMREEREACAQIAREWDAQHTGTNYGACIARLIEQRGQS